jgi:hypothetical protein
MDVFVPPRDIDLAISKEAAEQFLKDREVLVENISPAPVMNCKFTLLQFFYNRHLARPSEYASAEHQLKVTVTVIYFLILRS